MNDWKKEEMQKNRTATASVMILLSTYNAQPYIREQLDSLLAQTRSDWQLVVRDDGSQDNTPAILQEYSGKYPQISYYSGDNLGAKGSFFDLMKHVQKESFRYVAFCDQDDYWLPEKLERATTVLQLFSKKESTGQTDMYGGLPLLYCGKPQLTDKNLSPMEEELKRTIRPGFANALVENIVTGCTTVINRSMYELVLKLFPDYCIMHDWWMYLTASCFGQVLYDEAPMIYYRQHENNVMGIENSRITELKHRTQKFKSRKSNITMQAEELLRLVKQQEQLCPDKDDFLYVSLEEAQQLLKASKIEETDIKVSRRESLRACKHRAYLLANYKKGTNRWRLAFGKVMYRQRKIDDLIFRLLFLLGLR